VDYYAAVEKAGADLQDTSMGKPGEWALVCLENHLKDQEGPSSQDLGGRLCSAPGPWEAGGSHRLTFLCIPFVQFAF
jgi:hypothetical protein